MALVLLGNPQPIFNGVARAEDSITTVHLPEGKSLGDMVRDIGHVDGTGNHGLWGSHSAAPAPSWVESDDPQLAAAISARFGCPIGRPAQPAAVAPAQ